MRVWVDASTLIALDTIGELAFLRDLMGRVAITAAIAEEVFSGRESQALQEARGSWIEVVPVRGDLSRWTDLGLGRGEASLFETPKGDRLVLEATHLPLGRLGPSEQVHEEGRVGKHERPSSLRRRANRSRRFASMARVIASAAFRSTTPTKSVKDRRRTRRRTTSLNDSPGRFDAARAWYASSEREIVRATIRTVCIDSVYIDPVYQGDESIRVNRTNRTQPYAFRTDDTGLRAARSSSSSSRTATS